MEQPSSPSVDFLDAARAVMSRISDTQVGYIKDAARVCADCISRGGLVHLFATGHSRVCVEEIFPRYGSFPGFHPMVELSLTYHTEVVGANGHRQAIFLENVEGFGKIIFESHEIRHQDVMVIFSNSGVNSVIVDVALAARAANIPVIAVTSIAHTTAVPAHHSSGFKLYNIADIVIDNCCPPGDALVKINGLDDLVGPGSTIASVAVANALKCEVASELVRIGQPPTVFVNPFFGAEESKRKISECYEEYRRRTSRPVTSE
jgi:uncharacterized phosphosugar-binding protein